MASQSAAGGPRGLAEVLERWLQSPLGASQCCRSSGAVPIIDAIGMCAELRELSGGSIARLASAVGAEPPEGPVAVDAAGQAVRLRSVSERVRAAAERQVMAAPGGGASLLDLLEAGAVAALLGGVPEVSERLEVLRQALGASERVEVCGSRAAARGPAPPADSTPPRVPSRSLQLDVLGGVGRDDGQAADALSDALSDAEPQGPGADGDAPTPESAFRTPSLGSEPGACGSSPSAPGGAQGCGESPATGRECAAGAAHLGAAAAAAAAGASQSEHAPHWSGPEDQQFMPLCGGAGGQWLWCPLVLPVEAAAAAPTGASDPLPGEAPAAGPAALGRGDDACPPGLPAQLGLRGDGSDAEASQATDQSRSCGADGPAAAPPPHEGSAGAALGPEVPCAPFAGVPGEGQWVWFPAEVPAAGSGAFEPAPGWAGGQWPGARSRRPSFRSRHAAVVHKALQALERPSPQLASKMGPDGSVSINTLFAASARLSESCWHNPEQLVLAIKKTPDSHQFITADKVNLTVRALSHSERVCVQCEDYLLERQQLVAGPAPIWELLQHPPVQVYVATAGAGASASSDSDYANAAEVVAQALAESTMLEVSVDESGDHFVVLLPPSEPLRAVVKPLLESDEKLIALLRNEGEVSLAFLAEHPSVRIALARLKVDDKQAMLTCLQAAVEPLEGVEFDASGMSFSRPSALPDAGQAAPGQGKRRQKRWHPEEKDVKKLRDHFSFYFDEFNLQHNKVLMARMECLRDKEAQRPFFRLSDVSRLPRIEAVLSRYDQEGVGWLLEAVFQAKGRLPVRLSWRSDRGDRRSGHWQGVQSQPVLELAYAPRLRHLEFVRRGPDTEFLLSPGANPTDASGDHPLHVVVMVSYSVSSDLSHSQSPKARDIQEQIMSGDADPNMLDWEERQKKLVRQLRMHNADVICLQGVQSVGFKERNSEADPEWFTCDDEPANNHLAHLYRDLSKANYGIVFAPVMQMPSSSALCLGNAILWKRNRWHMHAFSDVFRTAVVAVLKSKVGGPPLAACSYKPPDVWAQDWNERIPASELLLPATRAQDALAAAAAEHGARPLLCGDFALEPRELLPRLAAAAAAAGGAAPAWHSACWSVMGSSPWTSAVKHSEGKATDLILHDGSLRPLAALGGLPERVGLLEFLRAGNPSDHLFQVAAFSCAEGRDRAAPDGGGGASRGPPGGSGARSGSAGLGQRPPRQAFQ